MSKNILNPNAKKLQLSGTYGTFGKRNNVEITNSDIFALFLSKTGAFEEEAKRKLEISKQELIRKYGITEEGYPTKIKMSTTYGEFGHRIATKEKTKP